MTLPRRSEVEMDQSETRPKVRSQAATNRNEIYIYEKKRIIEKYVARKTYNPLVTKPN